MITLTMPAVRLMQTKQQVLNPSSHNVEFSTILEYDENLKIKFHIYSRLDSAFFTHSPKNHFASTNFLISFSIRPYYGREAKAHIFFFSIIFRIFFFSL